MTDTSSFDTFLGGSKTYITAGLGIIIDALAAFHVWTPDAQQLTAVNGVVVLAAAAFLRMGVKKAQLAAAAKP